MGKLVSMKRAEKSESKELAPYEEPAYPYGLRICLGTDELKKLGIKNLPEVGKTMKIMAVVEVSSISMSESQNGGEYKSVDLQITELALDNKKDVDAKKLYPEA